MSASFTTFAADTLCSDLANNHILLVTCCSEFPHKPKMHLLSKGCDNVIQQSYLDALPAMLAKTSEISKFSGKAKKGAACKKTVEEEIK